MRYVKAFLVIGLLLFSLALGVVVDAFAADPRARTISIFRVDGDNARLARSGRGSRVTIPRDGQRLSGGNVLTTGHDTQVSLALDADSILRMDVSSRVQVGSVGAFRRRLSLTVSLGSVLVNITDQDAGLSTDIVVGNTAFSIRGTMFTMSRTQEGDALIVMLSGEGIVEMPGADGERIYVPLAAREVMVIYDESDSPELRYEVNDMVIEDLPLFTLEEIVNNYEYLLDIGTVTEYMLVEASHLIPILREQREQDRAYWDRFVEMLVQDNPPDITIFPFDEYELIVEPVQYEEEEEEHELVDDDALARGLIGADDDPDLVTITWNPNGGSVSPTTSLLPTGSMFFDLPIPSRPGFVFEGWYDTSAEAGGNPITHESIVPSSNTTFWARWVEDRVVVTISWNANGGSVMPAASHLVPGTQFMTLPVPTRSGHIFAGWYDTSAATGGTQLTHASIVPDSNAQFWARWVAEVTYVAIVWNMNPPPGAIVPLPAPTQTFEVPGNQFSTIPPAQFGIEGYSFAGWFNTSAATGGTQITHSSIVPNSDTHYWARWTQDFIPVTHISGVPSSFAAGSQTFTVQIHPGNATNANAGITWSVVDCGGTGAVVFGSTFNTHSPGVMHVRATIPQGTGVGIDFTQDFWIAVD